VSTEVADANLYTSSEVESREQFDEIITDPESYRNHTMEAEESIIEESEIPQIHIAGLSHEMFKIKLRDGETLQVTCSKPAKLEVLLAELQVHIAIPENQCHLLEYCENTSIERLTKIETQEQFDGYLQLENRPPLIPSTSIVNQPAELEISHNELEELQASVMVSTNTDSCDVEIQTLIPHGDSWTTSRPVVSW